MRKPWIPFFLFALYFILVVFPSEFTTSVVPGWHTTIYPPYFFISLVILVILLANTIGYWILAKRGAFHLTLFISHMLLTLPVVAFSRSQALLEFTVKLFVNDESMLAAYALFMLGQVLFLIYFFRMKASSSRYE